MGLVLGWALRPGDAAVAEVGGPAPDFTVPLIGGGTFTLSDQLAGKDAHVVLNLWASWCGHCRAEVPELSAFSDAHDDVKVVGVAVEDTFAAAESFAEEVRPSYDVGIGDQGFQTAYPRVGLPVTYVIDAEGTVIELYNGILTEEILEDLVFG